MSATSTLGSIREDFLALEVPDRLQLLLEFSDSRPDVPEGAVPEDHWERVEECQSPCSFLSSGKAMALS